MDERIDFIKELVKEQLKINDIAIILDKRFLQYKINLLFRDRNIIVVIDMELFEKDDCKSIVNIIKNLAIYELLKPYLREDYDE